MKRSISALFLLAFLAGAAAPARAAGLTLSIKDGRVSIDAQDVTLRQILAEWARVGKTQIVNLERVSSAPMTIKLEDVPEDQALDILLRSVPGYVAAPRAVLIANASVYDRILIMPTTVGVAPPPAVASATPVARPGGFMQAPSTFTQLRPPTAAAPLSPGALPAREDQNSNAGAPANNDPAIAAAAAAGLITVPAAAPTGGPRFFDPRQPAPAQQAPATDAPAKPDNPFAPTGTARPGFTPAPPPAQTAPRSTLQPPQPDPQ